jgi:hypothetical protein
MRKNRMDGSFHHAHSIENFKRRRALPPIPGLDGEIKFFERILSVRKVQDLVFITKTVAKNR